MSRALRYAYHLGRLVLGGLFLYAGLAKGADVAAFAGTVAGYKLLPYAGNILVAATLPYMEMLAGSLLVLNIRVRPAALLLAVLTILFMGALASAMARGLQIDCGCFGDADKATPAAALVRDGALLALAALVYRLRGRQQG